MSGRDRLRSAAALAVWAFGVWLLLTWTATAEQLIFGAVLALLIAGAMAGLGPVAAPWSVLRPRVLLGVPALALRCAGRIVRANLVLAVRIWSPSLRLRSGMVVVPTEMHTDGELAATGLLTSLIVDNQIVDVDRTRNVLQYHAVSVPSGTADEKAESINAPVERDIGRITRRS